MARVIKSITIKQRNEILAKYELNVQDIRLLERKGYNNSVCIIREIQEQFPQYKYNGLTVYSYCYKKWAKQKAP